MHGIYDKTKHFYKCSAMIIGICLLAGQLAGCSTAENLGLNLNSLRGESVGSNPSSSNSSSTQLASTGSTARTEKARAPVAFAPVFGPPVKVAKKLSGALKSKAQENKIVVQEKAANSGYTVRGYLSASPDDKGTKLSYVWDVTGSDGKRAHRITGEEVFPGKKNPKDPWSVVDQSAIDQIASKTAVRLATWLPENSNGNLVRQASLQPAGNRSAPRASASAGTGSAIVIVPPIEGAPGDGKRSLASALKKKMASQGMKVGSSRSSGRKFMVQGVVNLNPAANGQQNIKLIWKVYRPDGTEAGSVTQQNTIPKGSLDGNWGATADYVAEAASSGIIKLIKDNSKKQS